MLRKLAILILVSGAAAAAGCAQPTMRRGNGVADGQSNGYSKNAVLVVQINGERRRVTGNAVDLRKASRPPEELDCDTALCHYWFNHCGGILLYWDDSGDGKVDSFVCDNNVE